MAKKVAKKDDNKLNLESILFNCRDYLRGNASLNEKRDLLLTLVFLRFIGEKFEEAQEKMRQECIEMGINDEVIIDAFLKSPERYQGVVYVPEKARWSNIIKCSTNQLNNVLDDAIHAINTENENLKGCVIEGLFHSIKLEDNTLKKVVDEVNKISHKAFGEEKDLIGRVYEYFLKSFAINATKEDGEFYTPACVVQLIAEMIEPFDGTVYDPCCGSGGMFVQSLKYVEMKQGDISSINIYGQESEPATYRLAKMNLAVRGISHHLGESNASSFTKDMHKGEAFDYIMANPPFNLKKWYDISLRDDERWSEYSVPPEGNANYAWILHILSKLKANKGVAGFLLANGALGDSDAIDIRKKLIENDKIEAIIVLPRELFYSTDISVTLWILHQNKKGGIWHNRKLRNREKEILFMDLRQWTENPVKNEQKKKVELSQEQIQRARDIYFKWQKEGTDGKNYEEAELYRSVCFEEIEKNNFSLVPSRYIEFVDRDSNIDYNKVLQEIASSVSELLMRQRENETTLRNALKTLGYECK